MLTAQRTSSSYIEQFQLMIDTVMEEESHLIKDRHFVEAYLSLTDDAKLLFIRLCNRNLGWIRFESLDTEKYPNCHLSVEECQQKRLVMSSSDEVLKDSELLNLLRKPELKSIAQQKLEGAGKMKKEELIQALLEEREQDSIRTAAQSVVGFAMKQNCEARMQFQKLWVIYQRVEEFPDTDSSLMTSSILSNLTETDSRKLSFVNVDYQRIGLIWANLEEFEDYFESLIEERGLKEIAEANDESAWLQLADIYMPILLPQWTFLIGCAPKEGHFTGIPWFSCYSKAHVLTRCLSSIIYPALFRLKRHSDATSLLQSLLEQRIYENTKRGFWWDELARLTTNYSPNGKEEAMLICKQGLSDTMVVSHRRSSLFKRLASIAKSLGRKPIQLKDRPASPFQYPSLTLYGHQVVNPPSSTHSHVLFHSHHQVDNEDISPVRVEQYVLEHFELEGWNGYHAENSIITTLFGLLFWDILFDSSVPGVFQQPHQRAPLDLYTQFFFESRRDAILSRLDGIKNGIARCLIENVSACHRENQTICVGVNWNRFSTADMVEIAECIGPSALSRICELFARQYWSHRGGVPDLCLWDMSKKRFKLVEVKSENDRLSEKQVCWLQFLASVEVEAIVVHVRDNSYKATSKSKSSSVLSTSAAAKSKRRKIGC